MSAQSHAQPGQGQAQVGHTMELNTRLLMAWFVGILAFVILLVIAVLVYFYSVAAKTRAERIETTLSSKEANAAKVAAEAALGVSGNPARYEWVDAKAGTVQIPVTDAMKKVVTKYAAQPAK
ncbi:MAG: hypothetical protein NTV94_16500 [Planctomycetota bacterium]|nr:hypothetical protein [Planctomycetota bacterium]